MTGPVNLNAGGAGGAIGGAASPRPADPLQQKLRRACHEMEAAFLRQLFETMREGVEKEEGLFGESQGEEIFTQMLDDKLASAAADRMTRGLGEALYRQLAPRLEGEV